MTVRLTDDMTDAQKRAIRRQLNVARINETYPARVEAWRTDLGKSNERALRRAEVAEFKRVEAERKERNSLTGWSAVRGHIEAFERGEDTLFGFPRAKCDFPKVYADIDKAAKR